MVISSGGTDESVCKLSPSRAELATDFLVTWPSRCGRHWTPPPQSRSPVKDSNRLIVQFAGRVNAPAACYHNTRNLAISRGLGDLCVFSGYLGSEYPIARLRAPLNNARHQRRIIPHQRQQHYRINPHGYAAGHRYCSTPPITGGVLPGIYVKRPVERPIIRNIRSNDVLEPLCLLK